MKSFLIFFLIVAFNSFANESGQINPDQDKLKAERESLEKSKEDNLKRENQLSSNLKTAETEYLKASEEFNRLEELSKNHVVSKNKISDEINKSLHDLGRLKRAFSRKSGFYKCIQDQISTTDAVSQEKCKKLHPGKFTKEELDKIQSWENLLPLNVIEIKSRQKNFESEMQTAKEKIDWAKKNLTSVDTQKARLMDTEKILKLKEFDQEIIEKNNKYINCDEKTPEISLEEKIPYEGAEFQGPFFDVPRDNQDGLGTCYANTAKNLIVGASKGESVASFLDLALLYKDERSQIAKDGLDGGLSCSVLKRVNEKGYCPQEFAPFERGEKNLYTEGLMPMFEGGVEDEAQLVHMVKDFLQADENLKSKNSKLSKIAKDRAQWIIDKLKSDPSIKLPYPVVRHQIPKIWMLQEDFYWNIDSSLKTTEAAFLNDYKESYDKFIPKYIQAVTEGKKADQIFNLFRQEMNGFIQKYQLQGQLNRWKANFVDSTKEDLMDPNLKKSILASKSFYEELRGGEPTEKKDTNECVSDYGDLFEFVNNLKRITNYLHTNKIDASKLLNDQGKFKSSAELMQLIVAPSCLHSEQRKKLDFKIYCDDGYKYIRDLKNSNKDRKDKENSFRSRVAASLLQGYPLGNTFDRHINTIVGMRFNKEKKTCELKIRESQTGTSSWQSESAIFDEIEALTEVRRN